MIVTENIIARKDIVMESVNTSYLNRVQNYGNILKPMTPTTGVEHFTYFVAFENKYHLVGLETRMCDETHRVDSLG